MITKEDLDFIARAIAAANKHPAPDDYAKLVVDGAFPVEPVPLPVIDAPETLPTS